MEGELLIVSNTTAFSCTTIAGRDDVAPTLASSLARIDDG